MTATTTSRTPARIDLISRLVRIFLSIKPLANFAKSRARKMMVERAEIIGVPWRDNVEYLSSLSWESELAEITNPHLSYPQYYLTSFHAYDEGNLSWKAAWEVESASRAVHAQIWSDGDVNGDTMLRDSYHQALTKQVATVPHDILDLGCGIGMSTMSLQSVYPQAKVTGIDLSPYFLSVAQRSLDLKSSAALNERGGEETSPYPIELLSDAQYRGQQSKHQIKWIHGAAEATGLPAHSMDLVSACLMFHELPSTAAKEIIIEAHRLLRPGGYLAIMDMNPQSEKFLKMPPYILTLLKSTEPYLDQYFSLDLQQIFEEVGFTDFRITVNSPRHRTIVAKVK